MRFVSFQADEEAGVQMAPLIDCVFILLIFFLVTSMLQKPHKELALRVPDSGIGRAKTEEQEPLIIELTAANPDPTVPKDSTPHWKPFVVLGDEILTDELLERRLRAIAQQTPNRRVRIDCDSTLKWRNVVPVVDQCRFQGLVRVDVRIK